MLRFHCSRNCTFKYNLDQLQLQRVKIHFNMILPPVTRSSKWSRPFGFSNQNSVGISHLPLHATSTAILTLLDLIILIIYCEEYKLWSSLLWNSLQPPVTLSCPLLKHSPQKPLVKEPSINFFLLQVRHHASPTLNYE